MTLATPQAPVLPKEEITTIKPSEAMRLGALVSNALHGDLISTEDMVGETEWACALGAMMIGYGGKIDGPTPQEYLSFLSNPGKVERPGCEHPHRGRDRASHIVHLNDSHIMDRRAIADWLESEGL